jgi:membrane protein DedA with SNARE-associated domain/rhodanese-related sulfurtransferase
MDSILTLTLRHGYTLLALVVFLEAIGFPLPAALALLTAGAAGAYGKLNPLTAIAVSILAIVLGDLLLFLVGRYTGWALLGFLCRLSGNPESCILRSAQSFYRRGKVTLIVAKFIPGINTTAPPLAGSMKMKTLQFLQLDAAGAALYVLIYGGLGFIFSDFLRQMSDGLNSAGRSLEIVLAAGVLVYLGYRVWLWRKDRLFMAVPRASVTELAQRLAGDDAGRILVVDARTHGYYDPDATRIKGSIRLEPNNLDAEVRGLSASHEIYVYCTCIREGTSARVAHLLRERGFQASVIVGGLRAWRHAGYALEPVPTEDLVKLPTFS